MKLDYARASTIIYKFVVPILFESKLRCVIETPLVFMNSASTV